MLNTPRDPDSERARACGLDRAALKQYRSLVEQRGRVAWEIGDALCVSYGAPGPAVVHDGSTQLLERLADELGCSRSWLAACRATAAAWPRAERRVSIAWAVSRGLVARADRVALMDAFCRQCERDHVVPSAAKLRVFLDRLDARRARHHATTGRPRLDQVTKVERMALALDRESLARLVDRLTAALVAAAA